MSSGPTTPTESISRLRRQRGFRTKPSIGFPPAILKRGDSGLVSIEKGLESIDRGGSPCRPGCSAVVELFRAVCARELKWDGPAHRRTRVVRASCALCCVVLCCLVFGRSVDRLRWSLDGFEVLGTRKYSASIKSNNQLSAGLDPPPFGTAKKKGPSQPLCA